MSARAKLATAIGGSALGHLLLLGGAVAWIAAGGAPDNDDFSLREKLGDMEDVRVYGSNYAASRESGEPVHAEVADQSGSVWWSWQAPAEAADVLVEVELQGGGPLLGVYQGYSVERLERIAQSDNGTLSFNSQAGQDYHIAVAGSGGDAEGVISLRIQAYSGDDPMDPQEEEVETVLLMPDVSIEEMEEPEALNYVRTTQNDAAIATPNNPNFESDRNTLAASELPPEEDGLENMPSQEGIDRPFLEMADREVAEGELADDATIPIAAVEIVMPLLAAVESIESLELDPPADPSDSPQPKVEEKAELAPASVAPTRLDDRPLSDAGELAADFVGLKPVDGEGDEPAEANPDAEARDKKELAESKPPERKVAEPQPPNPYPVPKLGSERAKDDDVFQPQTRRNKVAGTISNRGSTAVDAAETPLGRYTRQVTGAVEKSWHYERRRKADYVSFGSLKVSFAIAASGKAGSLSILENEANPLMIDFTLGAILSAKIPPMPKEVRELLGGGPLEITYDVIIY